MNDALSSGKVLEGRRGGKLIEQLMPSGGNCSEKMISGSRRRRSCRVGSPLTVLRWSAAILRKERAPFLYVDLDGKFPKGTEEIDEGMHGVGSLSSA